MRVLPNRFSMLPNRDPNKYCFVSNTYESQKSSHQDPLGVHEKIQNMNKIITIMDTFDEGSTKIHQLISLSLLLRLVHLGINSTPVLSTAVLAAASGWY